MEPPFAGKLFDTCRGRYLAPYRFYLCPLRLGQVRTRLHLAVSLSHLGGARASLSVGLYCRRYRGYGYVYLRHRLYNPHANNQKPACGRDVRRVGGTGSVVSHQAQPTLTQGALFISGEDVGRAPAASVACLSISGYTLLGSPRRLRHAPFSPFRSFGRHSTGRGRFIGVGIFGRLPPHLLLGRFAAHPSEQRPASYHLSARPRPASACHVRPWKI